ncbi:unnamed protein product [Rotaria sp. Silwood1]|nr:unnamed protein product [Rotaria sp. Silwood1]CAF1338441.1 unnamed protein product [Rotaria sp. Silwood1]CAF3552487.1 unnamed protein product [Rotaria sp. Silwood1]CAF4505350.1 unnamed protein product [Rotaria sp. Silwood1]
MISLTRTDDENSSISSNLAERNRTYMLFVSEDVPIGHTQIIDTFDSSYCLKYSIKSNVYHRYDIPFEIELSKNESCTLNLHVIGLLDREQTPMYTIRRQLIDENDLSDNDIITIQLSIVILDVNDHVPQFESEHFHFIIPENIQPGSLIGRIQAHDPDIFLNGKISYTLFGHDLIQTSNRTMFKIDKDTGELYLLDDSLDYETKRDYTLMVEAKDHGDVEATLWPSIPSYADIIITVEDVNDQKPQIIFTMPNEDKQDDSIRFMNISNPSLNYEQSRLLNSFRSNINLLDNDAQLIHIIKEEPLSADTLLGLLHLRDNDQTSNGILSLELQTYIRCSPEGVQIDNLTLCRASDFFRLSVFRPNVYGLFAVRMLDRDKYENYILHLIANDNGDRPIRTEKRRLSSRQSSSLNIDDFLKRRSDINSYIMKSSFISLQSELFIYITLLDINDNSPIFDQTYFHIKINENQPKNTILTRLHAYDIDKDKNGTVRYELIIKERQIFSIDMRLGILRTKHILDREQCEFYRIGIRAYDLGYPNRKYSSMVIVDIQVNNLNDHVPYFIHDLYHFDVQENSPIGTIIGRLTIGDRDEQEPVEKYINLSTIEDVDIELFNSNSSIKTSSTINYSTIDFLFVDSYRNESLSNLFSIDSQGFIRTLVILDRELQSNYNLSILMYDSILKSYSLPTYIQIQILDINDNLPYEPFLSNPFDLLIEQINNEETIIYTFKPIDLDNDLNGLVSIECLNCTSNDYFHLIKNNLTNSSILITKVNVTVPDGIYILAFLLRDHGLPISRERFYTLKFNLTHRLINDEENDENFFLTTSSIPFLIRQKNFFSQFFLQKFQWHFLILLIISWFILVLTAIWTCYRYNRISIKKRKENEQQHQQFEIQVRQHEIINQPITVLPKSFSLPINSQQQYEKETLTHDDDEIEDTSYDADHIITDANFVLTSGCAANESNIRYFGNGVHFGYLPSNNNLSANLNSIAIRNHHTQATLRSTSFSRLHTSCSRCQLSSMMNSRETMLTDAATNTSYHEDNENDDIWRQMNNNNRMLCENASTILHNDYQFEPIDHDFPSIEISTIPSSAISTPYQPNIGHSIKRPVPINNYHSNPVIERPKKYHQQQYVLTTKRNSAINPSDIDSTARSYTLTRSLTTDQIGNTNNSTNRSTNNNRLYYYPSVQDVLDALNRRAFDKESFV